MGSPWGKSLTSLVTVTTKGTDITPDPFDGSYLILYREIEQTLILNLERHQSLVKKFFTGIGNIMTNLLGLVESQEGRGDS